jgi:hypothetical protein
MNLPERVQLFAWVDLWWLGQIASGSLADSMEADSPAPSGYTQ